MPSVSTKTSESMLTGLQNAENAVSSVGTEIATKVKDAGTYIKGNLPKITTNEDQKKAIINGYCEILNDDAANIANTFREDFANFSNQFSDENSEYSNDLQQFIIDNYLYQVKNIFFRNFGARNVIMVNLLLKSGGLLIGALNEYVEEVLENANGNKTSIEISAKIQPNQDAEWIANRFRQNLKDKIKELEQKIKDPNKTNFNGGGGGEPDKISNIVQYFPKNLSETNNVNNRIYHIVKKTIEKALKKEIEKDGSQIKQNLNTIYGKISIKTIALLNNIFKYDNYYNFVILLSLIEETAMLDVSSDKMSVFHKLRSGIKDYLSNYKTQLVNDAATVPPTKTKVLSSTDMMPFIRKYFQPNLNPPPGRRGGKRKTNKKKRTQQRRNNRRTTVHNRK